MIIAGIDMGIQYTKVAILDSGKVIGTSMVTTGGMDRPSQARQAYEKAISEAGIKESNIEKVVATGKGKFDVPFAEEVYTETISAVKAAQSNFPQATAVMSVGADETLAAVIGEKLLVSEFVLNQKCTAGLGTFISYLAKRLGMTMEQVSASDGPDAGVMNDGCAVFSELDALSFLNNGAAPEVIMASVNKAAATRAATVLADLTASPGDNIVLVGGLAKNKAFVSALGEILNKKFLIPEDAEYYSAIGAAICGGNEGIRN